MSGRICSVERQVGRILEAQMEIVGSQARAFDIRFREVRARLDEFRFPPAELQGEIDVIKVQIAHLRSDVDQWEEVHTDESVDSVDSLEHDEYCVLYELARRVARLEHRAARDGVALEKTLDRVYHEIRSSARQPAREPAPPRKAICLVVRRPRRRLSLGASQENMKNRKTAKADKSGPQQPRQHFRQISRDSDALDASYCSDRSDAQECTATMPIGLTDACTQSDHCAALRDRQRRRSS